MQAMAEPLNIHASCVALGGRAVLISGPSGSGKSDLALRLMDRGAVLVSDDRTDLRTSSGRLLASPPATIEGKLEVRSLGILAFPWEKDVPVALEIVLGGAIERFPLERADRAWLGIAVPLVALAAFEASAPIKVELALREFGL